MSNNIQNKEYSALDMNNSNESYTEIKKEESIIKNKRGNKRLTDEEIIERVNKNRQKALNRYNEKKELCHEQSKVNQQRYRELYKLVKELYKEDKINVPEEEKDHFKRLLCL